MKKTTWSNLTPAVAERCKATPNSESRLAKIPRTWAPSPIDLKLPRASERGAEHLGADEDRRTDHRQYVRPEDAPAAPYGIIGAHSNARALSAKARVDARSYLPLLLARCQQERGEASSGGVAGLLRQHAGLDQGRADAVDLGTGDLNERRAHHGARQAAEQHQRLLHAVVHVGPWVGVENAGQRIDAIIDPPRLGEIVRLDRVEQLRLQIGDDAARAGEESVAAQVRANSTATHCGSRAR